MPRGIIFRTLLSFHFLVHRRNTKMRGKAPNQPSSLQREASTRRKRKPTSFSLAPQLSRSGITVLTLLLCVWACTAFFYAPLPFKRSPIAASSSSSPPPSSEASSALARYEKAHAFVAAARPRTPIFWMAPLIARVWKNYANSKRAASRDCSCGGLGGCGCAGGVSKRGDRTVLSMATSAPAKRTPRGQTTGRGRRVPPRSAAGSRPVHVVAVVPGHGARGKLEAPWTEVMQHMHRRMQYVDPAFALHVVTEEEILDRGAAALAHLPLGPSSGLPPAPFPSSPSSSPSTAAASASGVPDAMYFLDVKNPKVAHELKGYMAQVPHLIALDSCPELAQRSRIGPARPYGPLAGFWKAFPVPTERKRLLELFETVRGFWKRGHSDDVLYSVLVVINAVLVDIPAVSEILKPVTLQALRCMLGNCGAQIIDCQRNPACKAALSCLEQCAPNDQVCRYRCIVQYESREFEQFALCILQKHNCLQNHAAIPMSPDPAPLSHFRGEPLSHEAAEEIQFGHLGQLQQGCPWSWKVIAGVNPAYDFFPSQHMTYYRKGQALWYQPVFRVITFDGREVWRRRLYRVRRGKVPGTFYYSVLDNGVTSSEFWRILDAADDLSWVLFYYSGAAAAAGQSYTGAILASPTGEWPSAEPCKARILAALDRAGIKEWELFNVHHDGSDGAPLEIDPMAEARFMYPGWAGARTSQADDEGRVTLAPAAVL